MSKKKKEKMTKTFRIKIKEGDAVIKLTSNKVVELIFGEDDETMVRETEWHEQEVYKASVQFALMIDTYFRNGEGLDDIIMHSNSGSIPVELLGKELLSISLAGADTGEEDNITEEELLQKLSDIKTAKENVKATTKDDVKDNVVDAATRFKKDE